MTEMGLDEGQILLLKESQTNLLKGNFTVDSSTPQEEEEGQKLDAVTPGQESTFTSSSSSTNIRSKTKQKNAISSQHAEKNEKHHKRKHASHQKEADKKSKKHKKEKHKKKSNQAEICFV